MEYPAYLFQLIWKKPEVTKNFIAYIIPWFGLPLILQSDTGTAFNLAITQQLSQVLGIRWSVHILYRLQSSGKVKRADAFLK
jgi:hypothetical protein